MELMDGSLVITLFRHGLTEANVKKAYLGWSDSALVSPAQISPVAQTYEQIISSDLGRCIETSKRLFPNQPLVLMSALRELNFGDWEGCTYEQLQQQLPYQNWLNQWQTLSPPRGESYAEFSHRLDDAWESIVREAINTNISTLAIVTHGGVIRQILHTNIKSNKDFWDWQIPYCGGYQMNVEVKGGEVRCTLLQEEPITARDNG